ncbi:MAG: ABC transporter ATP-binding protein [Arenicellales bacterium]|jgi:ABC-type multidrug transport system fused ATPase/permease subunit|nr:ABC transporter ATP-binding protein [Arenicellales bacterium]|tara:strand:- start:6019 stop:8706 length:2688 start_codon:yes stop_codon:yes gene_type:complete
MTDPKKEKSSAGSDDGDSDYPQIDKSIYRYVLRHTLRGQLFLLLLTAVTMPLVYISLDIPKRIINQAIDGKDLPEVLLGFEVTQISFLMLLSVAFLVAVVATGGLKYYLNVYKGVLGERMLRRFRFDLYARILRFPSSKIRRTPPAEIIPMITAETEPLGGLIGDAIAAPAFQGALLLTYLSFIFQQDVWLGLASIALYPPQMYLIPKLQAKVNALSKQRVKTVRVLATHIGETVQGAPDIHANDSGRFERARTSGHLGRIFDIREEIYRRKFFIKFLNNFLAQVTPFFFFSIGGYLVIKGEISLGALVAVLAAYKDIGPPWKELLKFYQVFEDTRVKYLQVAEQFEPENMIRKSLLEAPDKVEPLSGELKAQNLSYGEEGGANTVSSVGFSIPLDSHVAVVGAAGSGKSDVSALAARLIWPTAGNIQMGSLNWADAAEAVTGRRVGWVGSTPYIFSGTIAYNLYYGLFNAPKDAHAGGDTVAGRRVREATASGNSPDDSGADWLDLTAGGFRDGEDLRQRARQVLQVANLEDDVYRMGLATRIADTEVDADTERKILEARRQFQEKGLDVTTFDPDKYNVNISVAQNILFGYPLDPGFAPEQLPSHALVTDLLRQAGLFDDFLALGVRVAQAMTEVFEGISPDSDLFERFSLISGDDLPVLEEILRRLSAIDDQSPKQLPEADQEALRSFVYRLVPAQHRLGIVDEPLQAQLLEVRKLLRETLGQENTSVDFLNPVALNPGLDIESNVLFGSLPFGKPALRSKIRNSIDEVIAAVGLRSLVVELGLNADVGTSGGKLSSMQRQKLGFARALMKNPDLLVVDEALAPFDFNVRGDLIKSIREHMHGRGIFWALESAGSVEHFEDVIVMESGKILEQGKTDEMAARNGPLKTLLAT